MVCKSCRVLSVGNWEEGRARDAANPDDGSDSDVFGDFEDLETGREYGGDGDAATATALKAIQDEARARHDDKAAKKAAFDTEYDVGMFTPPSTDIVYNFSVD